MGKSTKLLGCILVLGLALTLGGCTAEPKTVGDLEANQNYNLLTPRVVVGLDAIVYKLDTRDGEERRQFFINPRAPIGLVEQDNTATVLHLQVGWLVIVRCLDFPDVKVVTEPPLGWEEVYEVQGSGTGCQ